ncbi:MAG: hypothetical protein ABIS50_01585 [Luteolibacter sp.]|uniref:hypothetical protein n=1 Tax=Luteolibacter sp. TaxID=1962973 RepID=UPI003265C318
MIDIKAGVTTPPRHFSPLLLVPVAVLAWIIIIGTVLRFLFGAEVSGGWAIAAGFFTMGALCFLVLLKELNDTFFLPAYSEFNNRLESRQKAEQAKHAEARQWDDRLIDHSSFGPRREALGLSSHRVGLNRQRTSVGRRSIDSPAESPSYAFDG